MNRLRALLLGVALACGAVLLPGVAFADALIDGGGGTDAGADAGGGTSGGGCTIAGGPGAAGATFLAVALVAGVVAARKRRSR